MSLPLEIAGVGSVPDIRKMKFAFTCLGLTLLAFAPQIPSAVRDVNGRQGKLVVHQVRKKDPSPCANEITEGIVCEKANSEALAIMKAGNLQAILVVQNVQSGALVSFAASSPSTLALNSAVLPLSTVKLILAASLWDHTTNMNLASLPSVSEMLVSGSDDAGRQLALALRKSVGSKAVLDDLDRYGFPAKDRVGSGPDHHFWSDSSAVGRLKPAVVFHSLSERSTSNEWADTLSIGESRFVVTAFHMSRFLQAIGNDGVMLEPVVRTGHLPPTPQWSRAVMSKSTSLQLQTAMRDVVKRGTAVSIAQTLADTGWKIGGKTGTGPGTIGPDSDGWFAGLVFDRLDHARFTVATFVKHGGKGGGNAARISAELARFLVGAGPLQ